MKFNICIILILSIFSSFSFKLKNNDKSRLATRNDLWKQYFSREPSNIRCIKKERLKGNVTKTFYNDKFPKPKACPYTEGLGLSSYFFDYIDETLQKEITKEFKLVFDMALAIGEKENVIDVYDLKFLSASNLEKRINLGNPNEVKTILQNYNDIVYKKSINIRQLATIMINWNWNVVKPDLQVTIEKYVMDKFDYNGDGRLSIHEFTMANIIMNINNFNCKQCYENIKKKLLYPMFTFLDCTGNGRINAETIWNSFKYLKKENSESTNIYTCFVSDKPLHTVSINDFVLRSSVKYIGVLDIKEFSTGILVGYANRQLNDFDVDEKNLYNQKRLRWTEPDFKVDKFCSNMNSGKFNNMQMDNTVLNSEYNRMINNDLKNNV